jgi:hypothetical protein
MNIIKYIFILNLSVFSQILYAQSWEWAVQKGGTIGTDAGTDKWGNVYFTTTGDGPYGQYTFQTSTGAILAKHSSDGELIWANPLGNVNIMALTIDGKGNCYITGSALPFGPTTLFGTNSSKSVSQTGNGDALLAKYDSAGHIIWAITWGFNYSADIGQAITNDIEGNVYVAGLNSEETSSSTITNAFLRKYDPLGNLIWDNNTNWKGGVNPRAVTVDDRGNCWVTGALGDSAYFDNILLTPPYQKNLTTFLAKYNTAGNVTFARTLGTNMDEGNAIDIDKQNNLFITGLFSSPSNFDAFTLNSGNGGAFIIKLDTSGAVLAANCAPDSYGFDIDSDENGDLFMVGQFTGQFNFSSSTVTALSTIKPWETYVAKLNSHCIPVWLLSTTGPAQGSNGAKAVATDFAGNAFITGAFGYSTLFGQTNLNSNNGEIYIAKISNELTATDLKNFRTSLNWSIYPVPTGSELFVQVDNGNYSPVIINVANVMNQIVFQQQYIVLAP